MADKAYTINKSDLTSVANAIRSKGGTTATLSFPNGFIEAINKLGGGSIPTYTYSGTSSISKDGTNWVLALKTSGTLKFTALTTPVDIFIVGGGGGGGCGGNHNTYSGGGGGGGGYVRTFKGVKLATNTNYYSEIGVGGTGGTSNTALGTDGGTSAIRLNSSTGTILLSAPGGKAGGKSSADLASLPLGGDGGSGGGAGGLSAAIAGGNGGINGANGTSNNEYVRMPGKGQEYSTRAFEETSGTIYGCGGGGGAGVNSYDVFSSAGTGSNGAGKGGDANGAAGNGTANTGGGGGGGCATGAPSWQTGGNGGSGIIIIRNAR